LDSIHKEENQIIPLEQKILIQGGNETGKTSIFMQIKFGVTGGCCSMK
jgi:archaellum biogenesis ATPase FlaH